MQVGSFIFFLLLAVNSKSEQFLRWNTEELGEKIIKVLHKAGIRENIFISPQAIVETTAVLYNGARGRTRTLLWVAFDVHNASDVNTQMQDLIPQLRDQEGGSQFVTVVRKLFVSKDYQIDDNFKTIVKKIYQTDVRNLDFSEPLSALSVINRCVAEQSKDIMEEVLQSKSLKSDATLVSVVGAFVQGAWTKPFDASKTTMSDFYVDKDTATPVETMEVVGEFNYYEDADLGAKFVQLPFAKDGVASMDLILPTRVDGFDELVKRITETAFPKWEKATVKVTLPKFEIDSRWDVLDLIKKVYPALRAFGSGGSQTDFAGIVGGTGEALKLSVFQQLAYIRINEAGIVVPPEEEPDEIPLQADSSSDPNVKEFKVDHPFAYRIHRLGFTTFRGFIMDPSKELNHEIINQ